MKTEDKLPATSGQGRAVASPFDQLHSQIDRLFSDFSRGFGFPSSFWDDGMRLPRSVWGNNGDLMPSMEMHDADGKVTISAELPGVDEKDISISVADDMLTISGEKKSEFETKEGEVRRSERSYGKFSRSVSLPFTIDGDKVDARFDKGVLKLTIDKPKDAQPQTKKIAIRHWRRPVAYCAGAGAALITRCAVNRTTAPAAEKPAATRSSSG